LDLRTAVRLTWKIAEIDSVTGSAAEKTVADDFGEIIDVEK
jgi:hypothetical protein